MKWTPASAAFHSFEEVDNGRRRSPLSIANGENRLTPARSFVFKGEHYRAGVTRVSPDHEVCSSEFARLLTPAYSKEASIPILEFLKRVRGGRGQRRATNRHTPAWRLPDRASTNDQSWRL
jgi:hypothetical protein